MKSLSGEELEARLFPHHKVLTNRTSLKLSASASQCNANRVSDANSGSNSKNSMMRGLMISERLDDFNQRENEPAMIAEEEVEHYCVSQLMEIGHKTSTGGWFVCEGESVLIAQDDGSCSLYDVANRELFLLSTSLIIDNSMLLGILLSCSPLAR